MTFDDVLNTLVATCETWPDSAKLDRLVAVRDVHGRVSLVVRPVTQDPAVDLGALKTALSSALGDYFTGEIWSTLGERDSSRLGRAILGVASEWNPDVTDVLGRPIPIERGRWRRIERHLSKLGWLDQAGSPPWEMGKGPPIVAFYSFKGGVGRTTALASCGWQWARSTTPEGRLRRVVVIDLDLEAPGLSSLFLSNEPRRGVLDFVVDHVATGQRDLGDAILPASALSPVDAAQISVVSAGRVSDTYLEKLARLDYVGSTVRDGSGDTTSPVAEALRSLLHEVRRVTQPDVILLDSRAGFHDLGGLALHGLAHVDVLFGRASEQSYRGMEVTIQTMARRPNRDSKVLMVHTFAPTQGTPEWKTEVAEFRARSYQVFRRNIYPPDDIPDENKEDALHFPLVLQHNSDGLSRITSLAAAERHLFAPDYVALYSRLDLMCQP